MTVDLRAQWTPGDDATSAEITSATARVESGADPSSAETLEVHFAPTSLTAQASTASATISVDIGSAVTLEVAYTVQLADGSVQGLTTGLVMDPARPSDVCPTTTTSTVAPATAPATSVSGADSAASPAKAQPAQPRYTG